MQSVFEINWHEVFVPTVGLLELVLRGSVIYLFILIALRLFRREAGALNTADLLVVVLVADAAQNAMASEYHSITEGVVLVATIFAWNYLLDWLGYQHPQVYRLLHPPPPLLAKDGRIQRHNLRAEMITRAELMGQLREQGIEDLGQVKRAYLEADGHLSVIKYDDAHQTPRDRKRSLS